MSDLSTMRAGSADRGDAVARWTAVLDGIDVGLDDLERQLVEGELDDVPTFPIPVGLPPLPAACADRAQAVSARHRDLEQRLRARMASMPRPAARAPRSAFGPTTTARFDVRG